MRKSHLAVGASFALSLFAASAGASWPVARHDPERTASAIGASDIKTPVPFWRYYLGGSLASASMLPYDIDHDGQPEVLYLMSGRVHAKKISGTELWQTDALGVQQLFAVDDFDGDGAAELLVSQANAILMLDARTGSIRWREPSGELGAVGAVRVGDLNGDGRPDVLVHECACCATSSSTPGFAWTFAGGFGAARHLWALPAIGCGSANASMLADVDGDGSFEFVTTTTSTIVGYRGSNGTPLGSSPNLAPLFVGSRCYPVIEPRVAARPIICATDTPLTPGASHRLTMLRWDGTTSSFKLIWQHDVGDVDAGLTFSPEFAADLDGDGKLEVVATGTKTGGAFVSEILDFATGSLLVSLPDARIGGVAPIDAAGKSLVLTTTASSVSALRFSRAPAPAAPVAWSLPQTVLATYSDAAKLRVQSVSTYSLNIDFNGDGVGDLVTMSAPDRDELQAYAAAAGTPALLRSFSLPKYTSVSGLAPIDQAGAQERLFVARNDGLFTPLDSSFAITASGFRFGGFYARGAWPTLSTSPVVGALGGKGESVIVADSRRRLVRVDALDATNALAPQELWFRPYGDAPAIVPGLDGGGKPGVVCRALQAPVSDPAVTQIVALHADGSQIWASNLDATPFGDIVPAKRPGGAFALVTQWGLASDLNVWTRALDGATGTKLWDSGPVAPGAGRQPTGVAAHDWNSDGTDDVVMQGAATRVLSGVDGSQMMAGGSSASYFLPTLLDVDGDGTLEVTLHGGNEPATTYSHDLKTQTWVDSDASAKPFPYGAFVRCGSATVLAEGSWAVSGRIKFSTLNGPNAGATKALVLAAGRVFDSGPDVAAAGLTMGQLTHASAHANLAGDGKPEVVVGSSDGFLYAVDPCAGTLLWSYDFKAPVGEPVFGDTNGDGLDEIIVSVGDGYLYDLRNAFVSAPTNVIDIDPAHGLTDADIDTTTTTNSLSGRWDPVTGAAGYEVAGVDARGAALTTPAWTDVGTATRATISGLTLTPGDTYFFAVRAYVTGGQRGPDASSNGVTVVGPTGDAGADGGSDADAAEDVTPSADADATDASVVAGAGDAVQGGGCSCSAGGVDPSGTLSLSVGALTLALASVRRRAKAERRP